jgi:hypothetical protein
MHFLLSRYTCIRQEDVSNRISTHYGHEEQVIGNQEQAALQLIILRVIKH